MAAIDGIDREDEIKELLHYWARWAKKGGGNNLGYPSRTLEGRAMEEGAVIRSSGRVAGPMIADTDAMAEAIDSQVVQLVLELPLWGEVIKAEYLLRGNQKFKARKSGVGYSMYRQILGKAHAWMMGNLAGW